MRTERSGGRASATDAPADLAPARTADDPGRRNRPPGRRLKRTGLILMAGIGAAIAVAVALALLVGYGTTVGPNVAVNPDAPIDANNSPAVARNPRRPSNLVVVHRVDQPGYSALMEASSDGGSTWRSQTLPLPGGADRPFAPDVAFGPDGTLYVLYVNLEGVANTPANLWLATSPDGGRTLSAPVRVAGKLTFQSRLAVGPEGEVYATWLQAGGVGLFRLGPAPSRIVVSRSTDGGRTFSPPVPASDPGRERVGAASPIVDPAGRVAILYEDFKGDRRDFENLEGPPWEEPFALVLTRSDNGGQTFSPGVEVDSGVVNRHRFVVFLPPFPSLAAGPGGSLFAAWADGRSGDDDVLLRRSGDGGATWSEPVRVNDDPRGSGSSQSLPQVSVSDSGRVDVVFLDRRRDRAGVKADAWLASSSDGGRSFQNLRLSSRSFDTRIGVGTPHGDPTFGSRLALDSHGPDTFAAWTDTRVGTASTGRQDIAATAVRRLPRWPVVVWPPLAGLGVVAVLWLRTRPRPARRTVRSR